MPSATGDEQAKAKTVSEMMADADISLATLRLAVDELRLGHSPRDPLSRSSVMGPDLATALTYRNSNIKETSVDFQGSSLDPNKQSRRYAQRYR